MNAIIHFDVAAVVLLLILLYTVISRKMTKGVPDKLFISLILITLGSALADTAAILLDGYAASPEGTEALLPALYCSHSIYLILHNYTTVLYLLFIVSLTDTWHKLKNHRLLCSLFWLPIAVITLIIAVNPFTGILFYFDGLIYTRGMLFPLMYEVAALYAVAALCYLVCHRKLFTVRKMASVVAIAPLLAIAMIVQYFFPLSPVEMYANALGLMFASMTVQTAEETIDSFTGLQKYSAYADDMKKNFLNKKYVTVILINPINFIHIQSYISYDATTVLLKCIAEKLIRVNRELKLHARLCYLDRGRFRVVLHGAYRGKAEAAANRINDELKKKIAVCERDVELLCSICVAECPEEIEDFKTLMSFGADFHEKIKYTGLVMHADEIFGQKQFMLMSKLDDIIERAYVNHKFQVYYQPIYSIKQKRFVSAEALLRLIDDEYGFVSPELFIPAAEKSGAIYKIGDYVTEEVCRFIASEEYKTLGLDYIEINLSAAQCAQDELVDNILAMLKKYGVSPDSINLEITETAAAESHSAMERNMQKLSESGISFSLDDYGTGYSNIKRVVSLPLKIVKLDKAFVDEMNNPKMHIVVKNTVKMLKDMKMEIVAEGIETRSMVEQFAALSCDYIQGYYFSKPVPEDKFVEFIRESMQTA